ncbi:MAG: hypothetical protein WBE37_11880 [Bryobacteraceae bacterium]
MFRTIPLLALLSLPAWPANGPIQEASAPAIVGQAMPGFYDGYLYSAEPRHMLTLFAPDGHELFSLPIQGHGNGQVAVESVAVDTDGTLAVAWRDSPNAGIDIRDLSGTLVRSIDTGQYVPAHLSFGADHSLWALGYQRVTTKYPDQPDYPIVRKYSSDGKEAGAYLPRSLFPAGIPPGNEQWQSRRITVTADRVGIEVFSGTKGNQREWVELDLNGNVQGRWKLDPQNETPGVAFTSDDRAYVHRYNREAKVRQLFRLNRATSAWDLVSTPGEELYGADGDKLVFARWPDNLMILSWFPQP